MANKFLMTVYWPMLSDAQYWWKEHCSRQVWSKVDDRDFCQFVGITPQQWANYCDDYAKLMVSIPTYQKLELLSKMTGPSPHLETLFKVIEARNT